MSEQKEYRAQSREELIDQLAAREEALDAASVRVKELEAELQRERYPTICPTEDNVRSLNRTLEAIIHQARSAETAQAYNRTVADQRDARRAECDALKAEVERLRLQRDEWKAKAEANAAAAHAIEVIRERRLDLVQLINDTWRAHEVGVEDAVSGDGADPLAAVRDYEERRKEE